MLTEPKHITYDEFINMDENTEELLEYIDGIVYNQASPSKIHQIVAINIATEFNIFFKNKSCKPFIAPFDIILKNEQTEYPRKVIPDISIICDKSGLNDKNYIGIPTLIVEILSPSNEAHDLVTKMNLYQRFGVKEYWIVNPKIKTTSLYSLNKKGLYEQFGVYKNEEEFESATFNGLKINLKDIFE
ncbi:Uma2 family endonuclease [Clostridium sp. P21]|uniref:Uma2 family endonuclease n=1 Tax=Clostridium muellerianum TaxID=2716538 RepID=A0A7Y0HNU4_9CLOT|nr:Uma2 family endonuclease [Clostridium muellerianum]NMM63017.1 Uma2 family endonuclease [Clostridium muellerianum]